tara:strand:+ start:5471 stop:5752 length:282 start_codon:yes stop_codon:yes gene_type:complete
LNDKKNIQQSKRVQFRDGFPLSSTEINDIFDSYLYDLFTIIDSADPRYLTDNESRTFKLLVDTLSNVDTWLYNRKERYTTETKDNHTPNWRKI